MKMLSQLRVDANHGVVRFIVSDGMDQACLALSTEAARNLIADIEEAAGVADLENEEWKAEREEEAGQVSSPERSKP